MSTRTIEDIYELSPMQSGMLFHTLFEPSSRLYFEQVVLPFDGQISAQAFAKAWACVAAANTVLRTSIHREDLDKPVQVVHRDAAIPVEMWDLRDVSAARREIEFQNKLIADRTRGFELDRAPLLRVALARMTDSGHRLVLSFHHIILDGWSLQMVFGQFMDAYGRLAMGQRVALSVTRPYRAYIEWLQKQDPEAAQAYWAGALAGAGGPTGIAGPAQLIAPAAESQPEDFAEQEVFLSAAATDALREAGLRRRLTLNTLIQGAWALLLSRFTGRDDIVFGVTVSGRPAELGEVEDMIGLFINTVPLRVETRTDDEVGEWLDALQSRQFEARQFDHCALVEIREWAGLPGDEALFDTILAFENYPTKRPQSGERADTTFIERTNYPLCAAVVPGDGLQIRLLHNRRLMPEETVAALAAALLGILASLTRALRGETSATLARLAVGDADQARDLNATETDYPRQSLPALFAERVAAAPQAIAVEESTRRISYSELDQQSNRLARRLATQIVRGDHVALLLDGSVDLAIAMLAVLKAGAAYVPLDPAYPASRIDAILTQTSAALVLTSAAHSARVTHPQALVLQNELAALADAPAGPLDISTSAEEVAYVMFTSGSAGRPKGIRVPHRAVARLVRCTNYVSVGQDDRIARHSNSAFDATTFEMWGALLNGATAVELERDVVLSPPDLAQCLRTRKISVMFLTTALFNRIVNEMPDAFAGLATLMFGGEAVDAGAVRALLAARGPGRLLHVYGPTESTTFATWQEVKSLAPHERTVSIGTPVANTTAYVLNPAMYSVPPGATGELYLGGDGLAEAYHNDPRLTAAQFVPDPFTDRPGARLYRTGDKVRLRADGSIDFVERLDTQIKLRGFRIELGEIEQILLSCPGVNEAVVIARGSGEEQRIYAYVTAVAGSQDTLIESLDAELGRRLPFYMRPSATLLLDTLPLTGNGKIDRDALPEPLTTTHGSAGPSAPRNPVESKLLAIWAAVLERDDIGVEDNFFDIGGHSLRATQLVSRVRRDFAVELPLRAVFENPTIARLAQFIPAMDAATAVDAVGAAGAASPVEAQRPGGIRRVSRDLHRRDIG